MTSVHTNTVSGAAVECQGVSAGYRGKPVLEDVSFHIESGEMVAILGPNGAGKSTLLRCMTGECKLWQGAVKLFGRAVRDIPAHERARLVAVVPQSLETPMPFTVQEIVGIGRTAYRGGLGGVRDEDRKVMDRAMVYADVVDIKNCLFHELSGGEKQRTVVAMALAQEPRIILLDEATSHLDMNHRLELMQIVERLHAEEKVTVIMVSHDLTLSAEFCPRLILLDHGHVVADGKPVEVLREELLERVYHCGVRVQQDPVHGDLSVAPARQRVPAHLGQGIHVHVIAGGGSGEEVLRALTLAGFTLTCGALNAGDSDAEAAMALGISCAMEKPFCALGADALQGAARMVDAAHAVVLCRVPFGPGNLANLTLLEQAMASGKKVLLLGNMEGRDFTAGHKAAATFDGLLARGAVLCRTVTDVMGQLVPAR